MKVTPTSFIGNTGGLIGNQEMYVLSIDVKPRQLPGSNLGDLFCLLANRFLSFVATWLIYIYDTIQRHMVYGFGKYSNLNPSPSIVSCNK